MLRTHPRAPVGGLRRRPSPPEELPDSLVLTVWAVLLSGGLITAVWAVSVAW